MDLALQELIQNREGTSKQYKSIANNSTLYSGLIRAYQVLESSIVWMNCAYTVSSIMSG